MTKGMGKGALGIRRTTLTFAAVLAFATGIALLSYASIASGAGEHNTLHPYTQSSDPSLGRETGDMERFSKPITVTGEILVVEAYDPESNYPYLKLLQTGDDRMYGLYGSEAAELQPGKRYEVTGQLDPSPANFQAAASADILVSGAKNLPTPRQAQRTLPLSRMGKAGFIMAYVSWPGSGPTMFDQHSAQAKGLTEWSSTVSNGQFSWDPVEMVEIELSEPLDCGGADLGSIPPGDPKSPITSWVKTVRGALEGEGYDLKNDYRALGIAFPENASICYPGAAAYAFMGYSEGLDYECEWYSLTGGNETWCNLSIYSYGGTRFPTIAHELGHTLGLPHANSMQCRRDGSPVVIDYARGCLRLEYGDRFDIMGGVGYSGTAPYNPAFTDRLGWIEDTEAERLPLAEKAEREVTLSPYAGASGVRLFQTGLPLMPVEGGLRSPGKVYAEYRTRVGLDSTLYPGADWLLSPCPEGAGDAVYLRVVPNGLGAQLLGVIPPEYPEDPWWPESYVLDAKPETVFLPDLFGLCDAGLQPGDSWEDPTGKLKIDFVRRAADLSSATVRVSSAGAQEERPTLELEKTGEGNGKIVIEEAGIECEDRCIHRLQDDSKITLRAVPSLGSAFRRWTDACELTVGSTCVLSPKWEGKYIVGAAFDRRDPPVIELVKSGEGKGKIVVEGTGIECEDRCVHTLKDDSPITLRAVASQGSNFRVWEGACNDSGTSPTCLLIPRWANKRIVRAAFDPGNPPPDPDPEPPPPDIKLSAIQLTPANLKVKAGKKARLTVQVTNTGLDEGDARVSLSSSSSAKAKVPGSISFKVPGESSATGSFTATTKKKQKGKVTITARLGSQTARASLVLAK